MKTKEQVTPENIMGVIYEFFKKIWNQETSFQTHIQPLHRTQHGDLHLPRRSEEMGQIQEL